MPTQDMKPEISESLERVGVTNLRTRIMTNWRGKSYTFIPRIEITIDLDREKKGAHMSRLIESISESVEDEVGLQHESMEEIGKKILTRLRKVHTYKKAEIWMKTELATEKKTPVTKKSTVEVHDVQVGVMNDCGNYTKSLKVNVLGSSVCPHAMDKNNTKSHVQRAEGILEIKTDYTNEIALEDMIACVEESMSSEVYTLLKTEDEKYIVNKMFNNPKFVEDVTREILNRAKNMFKDCKISAKTVSYESIHRHDVIAEGFVMT